MIGVQSFPELYTTLIGWQMYDQLWYLLKGSGLAFLPFIGIILRNIVQPYESQETKSASDTSRRRMTVDLLIMLMLVMFGVSPAFNLDASLISYTPVCQTDGQQNTYKPGDTGTTYDKAFSIPTGTIQVPMWWYAVMAVSAGSTSAAITGVSCVPDYRKMVTQVDMAQISDPSLKQELTQFESDCYLPARAQYLEESKSDTANYESIKDAVKQFGGDDTEWFGSHGFQNTYYQNLKASQPVPGFPYVQSDDINAQASQGLPTPQYGTPNCADWWGDSTNGLRTRLYSALPANYFDEFKGYFSNDPDGKLKDDVAKRIVTNNEASGYSATDNIANTSDIGTKLFESVGAIFSQVETYPTLYALSQSVPIVQALLLLMCFAFLPFILVFAGYKPSTFITGAVVIFSIFFWSFIWQLVGWTDSVLTQALFGDSWFSLRGPNEILVNTIIGFLIIVAPLFWFGFMSALGVAAGGMVSSLTGAVAGLGEKPAGRIGSGAGQAVKTVEGVVTKI